MQPGGFLRTVTRAALLTPSSHSHRLHKSLGQVLEVSTHRRRQGPWLPAAVPGRALCWGRLPLQSPGGGRAGAPPAGAEPFIPALRQCTSPCRQKSHTQSLWRGPEPQGEQSQPQPWPPSAVAAWASSCQRDRAVVVPGRGFSVGAAGRASDAVPASMAASTPSRADSSPGHPGFELCSSSQPVRSHLHLLCLQAPGSRSLAAPRCCRASSAALPAPVLRVCVRVLQ